MKRLPLLLFLTLCLLALTLGTIHAQQQKGISISAVIGPSLPDFTFSLTTQREHRLAQNQTIEYDINYSASSSAGITTQNTITVNFDDDKAPNGTHVTDYVIGSATKGYGDAEPIIDLNKRTITWIIDLPKGTMNQKLSFDLQTNTNYTQPNTAEITVRADMANDYVSMPQQEITEEYLFNQAFVTPGPTEPKINTIVTPTPSPVEIPLQILALSYNAISDNGINLDITTNKPTRQRIQFGTSPDKLTQTQQNSFFETTSSYTLSGLQSNTQYYMTVSGTDISNEHVTSDIFTFTTAKQSLSPALNGNVVLTSGNTVLLTTDINKQDIPFGVLPQLTGYELTYTTSQSLLLKTIDVIVKDDSGRQSVIGMPVTTGRTTLTSAYPGNYTLLLRVTDTNGNVIEREIARIKVISTLTVLDRITKEPIADAQLFLQYFDLATRQYKTLDTIKNPSFTDSAGQNLLFLLPGTYKITTSALGYTPQAITFTLGENEKQDLPLILLTPDPFNITASMNYLRTIFNDTLQTIQTIFTAITTSVRLFHLVATGAVGASVLLSALLFTFRTDMHWRKLFPFFYYFLFVITGQHKKTYLFGGISDPNKNPLSRVRVEYFDSKTNLSLGHTTTDNSGRFMFRNKFKQMTLKLVVAREGFAEYQTTIDTIAQEAININLTPNQTRTTILSSGMKYLLGECFELLLFLSLISEVIFLFSFGPLRTLPFFTASAVNLSLWLFFQSQRKI